MSYTRHNWVCGEVINDAKMNNIEDGIEEALECCDGGGSVGALILTETVTESGSTTRYELSETAQTIFDALIAGRPIYALRVKEVSDDVSATYYLPLNQILTQEQLGYQFYCNYGTPNNNCISIIYTAETSSTYPYYVDGGTE